MSNRRTQSGFTTIEILIALVIGGIILSTFFIFSFTILGSTVRNQNEAQLAVESQTILRSITEELRTSSSIRNTNSIPDPSNPGPGIDDETGTPDNSDGWTTSNPNLVLIVSTPSLNQAGEFIENPFAGVLYQNETVYYANGSTLYKRTLADQDAPGNRSQTSCQTSSSSCPQDIRLSEHFKDMTFVFYSQNNTITTNPLLARSIEITIFLEKEGYRQTTEFTNTIRVTIRNIYNG